MYVGLHIKYPLFLSDFNEMNFLARLLKDPEISNFMRLHLVGAKLFHADGWADRQTDRMKLLVAFHNFCKRA